MINRIILATIVVFCSFSLVLSINKILGKTKEKKTKYENHIGKKYTLNKDTLTIIDYSMALETFTLSDGTLVSYKFISKQSALIDD